VRLQRASPESTALSALWSPPPALDARRWTEQFRDVHAQDLSNLLECAQRHVVFTEFQRSDVAQCPTEAPTEFLLGPCADGTKFGDPVPDSNLKLLLWTPGACSRAVRHIAGLLP
jgi:hypothetical protein